MGWNGENILRVYLHIVEMKAAVIAAPIEENEARGRLLCDVEVTYGWVGISGWREKPLNRNIHERNRHSVWITILPHSKHKTNFWEVKELNTEDKNFKLLEIKTEEFFINTGSKHFFPKSPSSDRKSHIGLAWNDHGKEMRQEQLWLKIFHQMISKNSENKNTESSCISS